MSEQLELWSSPASSSSSAASRAKTFPAPETAPASPESVAGSGSSSGESSKSCAPPPSPSKTSRQAKSSGCPVCNTISCPLATASKPGALELLTWGPHTDAQEPLSSASTPTSAAQLWATPTRKGNDRKQVIGKNGAGLRTQALWPTPSASSYGSNQGGGRGPCGPEAAEPAGSGQEKNGPSFGPLGGVPDGLSARLDGHRWPAGLGERQHEEEPPRTAKKGQVPRNAARLRVLGNAVVPQVAMRAGWRLRQMIEEAST